MLKVKQKKSSQSSIEIKTMFIFADSEKGQIVPLSALDVFLEFYSGKVEGDEPRFSTQKSGFK